MVLSEAIEWLRVIKEYKGEFENLTNKTIIVCPPFQLLYSFSSYAKEYALPIIIGAQDISPFDPGAFTGEVNGRQIKEFADYVIIGHSERRTNFGETDEILFKKVEMAKKYDLKIVYCVQNENTLVPDGVSVIAYEPVFAIGTGHPDTPEDAEKVCTVLKQKYSSASVIYGGSVNGENV